MKKAVVTLMVALFATVVVGQTKSLVKPPELPKCILEWIKQNMKDYTVDKAYRIEQKEGTNKILYYYTKLAIGKNFQWMYFDDRCQYAVKISQTNAETDPPKPYPPIKAKPAQLQDEKKESK